MTLEEFFTDALIPVAEVMLIVAVAAAIVLPLVFALSNPKSLIKSLIGVGVLVVLFLVSWGIAGNEVLQGYVKFNVDESLSKLIGGGIIMVYLLALVSIVGIVANMFMKLIR